MNQIESILTSEAPRVGARLSAQIIEYWSGSVPWMEGVDYRWLEADEIDGAEITEFDGPLICINDLRFSPTRENVLSCAFQELKEKIIFAFKNRLNDLLQDVPVITEPHQIMKEWSPWDGVYLARGWATIGIAKPVGQRAERPEDAIAGEITWENTDDSIGHFRTIIRNRFFFNHGFSHRLE